MSYSVKRGPLAGIEFASERQYRNAKRYLERHGQIPEPLALAKAYQSQYETEQRLQRRTNMDARTYEQMRQYFAARAAQTEAAFLDAQGRQHLGTRAIERDNLSPRSMFMRLWDDAARANFTGEPMDRLMVYAGMRDTGGERKPGDQWEKYKQLITWYAQNDPAALLRGDQRNLPRITRGKNKGKWIYPWDSRMKRRKKNE